MIEIGDILNGIREEIRATPDYVAFTIKRSIREGSIWKIILSSDEKSLNELDEALEGALVWWPGNPPGTAEVLSVVSEESQLNLRFATQTPPENGKILRVYLPQYLNKLEELWSDDIWANRCSEWLKRVRATNAKDDVISLKTSSFRWLRACQKRAFALPAFKVSFLHGPPGTGKTRTLGALVAQFLSTFQNARVLLLSTTNVAVDEAITAVDSALLEAPALNGGPRIRMNECKRIGNQFVATKYKGRQHLLPKQEPEILEQLILLEASRPREEDVQAYATWKERTETLRAQMRSKAINTFRHSRLIAMTTTLAVYSFDDLREHYPADLIVFDESSQVGLAHALALAPLGKRALFTGDPNQLAPICRSKVQDSAEWLGQSMFSLQNDFEEATCFLDEQSRMTEPICHVVSKTFYQGRLKVASGCDTKWKLARDVSSSHAEKNAVSIHRVKKEGQYSKKYGGYIRYESAELISALVGRLSSEQDAADILVLTPFRAQRRLIKTFLKNGTIRGVRVSTVHRAQGSECHTVIFDPVSGSNNFLNTEDAPRLINVALSRAKARLVVFLSPDDLVNPTLQKFNAVAAILPGIMQNDGSRVPRIQQHRHISRILDENFPQNAINKEITIPSKNGLMFGRILEVSSDGESFKMQVYETGEVKKFITEFVRKNAKGRI